MGIKLKFFLRGFDVLCHKSSPANVDMSSCQCVGRNESSLVNNAHKEILRPSGLKQHLTHSTATPDNNSYPRNHLRLDAKEETTGVLLWALLTSRREITNRNESIRYFWAPW